MSLMVMPANNTSGIVHWLAGKAPGSIGHLYTPARTERPKSWLPYALDNGAFALAVKKLPFDDAAWERALDKYTQHAQPPRWLVVPDVPFDGQQTIDKWNSLAESHATRHVPLALAVQDGMNPESVLSLRVQPEVIFVGGTTEWKWSTIRQWCEHFPRVHVARVNGRRGLDICAEAGAESCDGSGWFRGDVKQILELVEFIAEYYSLDVQECREAAKCSRHSRDRQMVLRMEVSA